MSLTEVSENLGIESEPQPKQPPGVLNFFDTWPSVSVWAILICTVISQNVLGWNIVFAATTIGPYALAMVVMAFAIWNYVLSVVSMRCFKNHFIIFVR